MNIPFVDLKAQYKSIQPQIDNAISSVIEETAFIGGKFVKEFEANFSSLFGVQHTISCANGTDSLYIIMKMLGIGAGDEVITVANSWISSSETITQTGAKVVFVDVDPIYYSMDENKLEAAISSNTKAVIAVHLQGQMCNIVEIKKICDQHNIFLIEDCAQSHLSEYKNKIAGLFGIAASFSFYPGKNLGAYGDAGCIITNDSSLAEKCTMYARHGALVKHKHVIEGINSRLDGIQASILSAKLPYLFQWTEKRRKNAELYDKYLESVSQVITPKVRPDSKHSYHLYVIQAEDRDSLSIWLKEMGIETTLHYPTILPLLDCYKYIGLKPSDFPVAYSLQNKILSLPMYPELSENQIIYIAEGVKLFYKQRIKSV